MDSFKDASDSDSPQPRQRNNSISKDDQAPESVTGMFSAQPQKLSGATPPAATDILSELKAMPKPAPAQPPVQRDQDAWHDSAKPQTEWSAPAPVAPPLPNQPEASRPAGEFTRLFQAFGSAQPTASAPVQPPQSVAAESKVESKAETRTIPSIDITNIFTQLRTPQQPARGGKTLVLPRREPPGRVAPSVAAAPATALAAPAPVPPTPLPPAPGEFTRMMQAFTSGAAPASSIPENQAETPHVQPTSTPVAPPAPMASAPTSNSGSFTSLFNAISSPDRSSALPVPPVNFEPAARRGSGNAFSDRYKDPSQDLPRATPTAASPDVSQNASRDSSRERDSSRDSATKIFEVSPRTPAPSFQPASFQPPAASFQLTDSRRQADPEFSFPAAAPPDSQGAQGGFTKLFQALTEPEPAAKDKLQFSSPPLPSKPLQEQPPPMQSGPGEFTRLMNVLGEGPSRGEADFFPATPAPAPAPPPQGPGEFTRIIAASTFREPQGIADSPSTPSSAATHAAASPIVLPAMQLPHLPPAPQLPHLQMPPAQSPAQPPQLHIQLPPAQSPAQPQSPQLHIQMPPVPPAPAIPKLAPSKAPAAPKTKLQEMLPVLLVANAFLLLLLVVIVIFALRHH